MTHLLTQAQMAAIEAAAMTGGVLTGLDLMARAGRGVVDAILTTWPDLTAAGGQPPDPRDISAPKMKGRAVVLCGPGNNGGDGYVVARLLHAAGWQVDLLALAGAGAPDARANEALWRALGPVQPLTAEALQGLAEADLHVDALFGTGLSRPLTGDVRDIVACLAAMDLSRLVAVDLPSGLSADSGLALGPVPRAALTVTFDSPKLGHYLAEGPDYCGRLVVADIGIAPFRAPLAADAVTLVDVLRPRVIARLSKGQGHKYSHGHALVLAGGAGQGGAGRLAARAALRIGAGAVTLGCPADAVDENAAQLNAVMLRQVADAAGLAGLVADKRIAALCLGPGLGLGPRERDLLAAALACDGLALVLDADALTLTAGDGDLFDALHESCVLTPHDGEFARVFPDLADGALSRVDAVRTAAVRAGCVVLRKGPDTVIADPSGRCFVHGAVYARSAPWLATAGSGDVLAGIITGLLARGFAPLAAATTGAFLHASCALAFGPGLIAEDLHEMLPQVLRDLGV
ncbi:bifunctional ADP-dependent NAD(P)H-hydrate dehydratase/NAD(P)H-hydrate epimerase [Yoonia vestfoldensis]|uniref:bifunctional ADP-dependent NAD(P)H-hydrate dehydratase/NAD(P)H-hydrate epimerase n=1 Tax=Yoonia vestfoldensis TaxID=245188 RepID=UPI000364F373|nr:bifunctional ADP-dependent NAD(P)H-hydrate dehydratase/NAD(P)H-hydrate epimerase [Yoonia vestfoldensis]